MSIPFHLDLRYVSFERSIDLIFPEQYAEAFDSNNLANIDTVPMDINSPYPYIYVGNDGVAYYELSNSNTTGAPEWLHDGSGDVSFYAGGLVHIVKNGSYLDLKIMGYSPYSNQFDLDAIREISVELPVDLDPLSIHGWRAFGYSDDHFALLAYRTTEECHEFYHLDCVVYDEVYQFRNLFRVPLEYNINDFKKFHAGKDGVLAQLDIYFPHLNMFAMSPSDNILDTTWTDASVSESGYFYTLILDDPADQAIWETAENPTVTWGLQPIVEIDGTYFRFDPRFRWYNRLELDVPSDLANPVLIQFQYHPTNTVRYHMYGLRDGALYSFLGGRPNPNSQPDNRFRGSVASYLSISYSTEGSGFPRMWDAPDEFNTKTATIGDNNALSKRGIYLREHPTEDYIVPNINGVFQTYPDIWKYKGSEEYPIVPYNTGESGLYSGWGAVPIWFSEHSDYIVMPDFADSWVRTVEIVMVSEQPFPDQVEVSVYRATGEHINTIVMDNTSHEYVDWLTGLPDQYVHCLTNMERVFAGSSADNPFTEWLIFPPHATAVEDYHVVVREIGSSLDHTVREEMPERIKPLQLIDAYAQYPTFWITNEWTDFVLNNFVETNEMYDLTDISQREYVRDLCVTALSVNGVLDPINANAAMEILRQDSDEQLGYGYIYPVNPPIDQGVEYVFWDYPPEEQSDIALILYAIAKIEEAYYFWNNNRSEYYIYQISPSAQLLGLAKSSRDRPSPLGTVSTFIANPSTSGADDWYNGGFWTLGTKFAYTAVVTYCVNGEYAGSANRSPAISDADLDFFYTGLPAGLRDEYGEYSPYGSIYNFSSDYIRGEVHPIAGMLAIGGTSGYTFYPRYDTGYLDDPLVASVERKWIWVDEMHFFSKENNAPATIQASTYHATSHAHRGTMTLNKTISKAMRPNGEGTVEGYYHIYRSVETHPSSEPDDCPWKDRESILWGDGFTGDLKVSVRSVPKSDPTVIETDYPTYT